MALQRLFSKRVAYGVHFLCLLIKRQPQAAIPVAELALEMAKAWPETSATYLSKVVQALVQSGILVSLRGSAGGYGIARPPAELSLLDVVCALEGPLDASCPLKANGPCMLRDRCPNYHMLAQLQKQFALVLAQVSIAGLAHRLPLPDNDVHDDVVRACFATLPPAPVQPAIFPPMSPSVLPCTPGFASVTT